MLAQVVGSVSVGLGHCRTTVGSDCRTYCRAAVGLSDGHRAVMAFASHPDDCRTLSDDRRTLSDDRRTLSDCPTLSELSDYRTVRLLSELSDCQTVGDCFLISHSQPSEFTAQ